jgi:hydroxyacylglutathione hydrolase
MLVEKNVNNLLSSNSYVITCELDDGAWIVDPGNPDPLCNLLYKHNKFLKGILITHSHFDHIYGLNELVKKYPNTKVYASKLSQVGFQSAKLNGSYYANMPFIIDPFDINYLSVLEIEIFQNISAKIFNTPGHNNDCISFYIQDFLFTGDAMIPNAPVHTKSKFANKNDAIESLNMIINHFDPFTIICPGHGESMMLKDVVIPNFI